MLVLLHRFVVLFLGLCGLFWLFLVAGGLCGLVESLFGFFVFGCLKSMGQLLFFGGVLFS